METAPFGAVPILTVHLAEQTYPTTMYIGKIKRRIGEQEIALYLREYPDGKRVKSSRTRDGWHYFWIYHESTDKPGLATRYETVEALKEAFAKFKSSINETAGMGCALVIEEVE